MPLRFAALFQVSRLHVSILETVAKMKVALSPVKASEEVAMKLREELAVELREKADTEPNQSRCQTGY